ncbi:MAG: RluA family pseudouridine synthase [Planctomycetes bacterium]|nr:RluA family pseudouridine synthase [Planctomycetota bacterium]
MSQAKVPEETSFDFAVPGHLDHLRLPQVLAQQFPQLSPNTIFRLIGAGKVWVNQELAQADLVVRRGMQVTILLREGKREPAEARPDVKVLYENAALILIDKPAGMVVVPERHQRSCPLMESLGRRFEEAGEAQARPRIVHRLDRDTSGVLLVAKTLESQRWLTSQFMDQVVEKRYLAVVEGEVAEETGSIDLCIGPVGHRSTEMRASPLSGRKSRTDFRVSERFRGYTLLEVLPRTGRTHQVRVHLAAIGHALAVDPLYGPRSEIFLSSLKRGYRASGEASERPVIDRTTLHAASIGFRPDESSEPMRIEAPPPRDFQYLLRVLRKYRQ